MKGKWHTIYMLTLPFCFWLYLVVDDMANVWATIVVIACSQYIQSSAWMSLAYHVICRTEHWVVNIPYFFFFESDRFGIEADFKTKQRSTQQNLFMFISKCPFNALHCAQMWIIMAGNDIKWFCVCACVCVILLVLFFVV